MKVRYELYVGIDWASQDHEVCVLGREGQVIGRRSVRHSGSGLAELADWLTSLGEPSATAVAIEVPRGAVVESLLERDFHVFAINPKQLDRFRDRHTVAGSKNDRLDALVLADSLRTDSSRFRELDTDAPEIIQLRELTRVEEELKAELMRLSNRLRESLHRFFPQMLELVPAADEPWLWDLLKLVPTPDKARRIRARSVQAVLKAHRIQRISSKQVLDRLRTAALRVAPGTVGATTTHIECFLS